MASARQPCTPAAQYPTVPQLLPPSRPVWPLPHTAQVLDVLNRIGLSDSVLRLAERRQRLDKLLVYGGMLVTLVVVVGLYWWKKM